MFRSSEKKFKTALMSTNTTKPTLLQISNKLGESNRRYKVEVGNTREDIANKLLKEFMRIGHDSIFKDDDDDEIEKMATGIVKRGETFNVSSPEPKKREIKPEFSGVGKVKKEAGWIDEHDPKLKKKT
jgi:hypothetical protein